MRPLRGFSLLEMMISVAILVAVVAMVSTLVVFSARMVRQGEETSDSNEGARQVVEAIAVAARNGGYGVSNGLYVRTGCSPPPSSSCSGGTTVLTGAVVGNNAVGAGGSDDLWVVVPNLNALRPGCTSDTNAAIYGTPTVIQTTISGGNALQVRCLGGVQGAKYLVVSDPSAGTGALISTSTAMMTASSGTTPAVITYAEMATNFSSSPSSGGFLGTSLVFPVEIRHYYVDASFRLMMHTGRPATTSGGFPFEDDGSNPQAIARGIEDLQVVYGSDTNRTGTPNLDWSNTIPSTFAPGPRSLRALRVSAVSRGIRKIIGDDGKPELGNPNYKPIDIEDNIRNPAPPTDGYRRTVYTKRIELPNSNPAAL